MTMAKDGGDDDGDDTGLSSLPTKKVPRLNQDHERETEGTTAAFQNIFLLCLNLMVNHLRHLFILTSHFNRL